MKHDVLIVGGGLAGLCCARQLHQRGVRFLLLESSDAFGGRIRTDVVEGFRLDRGFQVFLTSYPEAQRVLDYKGLHLNPFLPGALVRCGGKFHTLADPWRRPRAAVSSLFAPVGTLSDKLRVARLRSRVMKGTLEERFRDPETTTLQALRDNGFSTSMIEQFFRPFLGGIFLDRELQTSSRMFEFVFRMFSSGDASLPAEGMEAIPRQLAALLSPHDLRLNARVAKVSASSATLDSGEELAARAVVLAVDAPASAKLLGDEATPAGQGVTCVYFAAEKAPIEQPVLVLNSEGPINNLCVPTLVAPTYGPPGAHLISVTVLGIPTDEDRLRIDILEQLRSWFGPSVSGWRQLRTYRIPYALPRQTPPFPSVPPRPFRSDRGIYLCGDHIDNGSIQGAMVSGRRAAEAVLVGLA